MGNRVTILTVGSRGDVQPFLALGLGLQEAGYQVRLAANPEFETFITERGLDFADMGPNPNDALLKLVSDEREAFEKIYAEVYTEYLRQWMLRGLEASADADFIIFTPVCSVGYDISEKLARPCCRASYMPYTPTREFPSAYLPFSTSLGPLYNRFSHLLVEQAGWQEMRKRTNRLRRTVLHLPDLPFSGPERRMRQQRVPILYGYSPAVVPKPSDWPEWVELTGYWFLETREGWQPPADLVDFLNAGTAPVYFELGSLTILVPETVKNILRGLAASGYRVIANPRSTDLRDVRMPEQIFLIDESVPHSWILPRVAAAITNGGPSTVAAVLRTGLPVQVISIFAGQHFWGRRVKDLGVGTDPLPANKVTAEKIARAARILMEDPDVRRKAAGLGRRIRHENGVLRAVEFFQKYFSAGHDRTSVWGPVPILPRRDPFEATPG